MNPIIKKQLEACKVANIPVFDDNSDIINIPKGSIVNVSPYQIGKCYIVELADYVLHPPEGNSIASNWNKGTTPRYRYYKCEIKNIVGKMVCILGFGIHPVTGQDTDDLWEGWIPQAGIKLLQELK